MPNDLQEQVASKVAEQMFRSAQGASLCVTQVQLKSIVLSGLDEFSIRAFETLFPVRRSVAAEPQPALAVLAQPSEDE